jgi:hypothetical protein
LSYGSQWARSRAADRAPVLTGSLLLAGAVFVVYPLSTNVLGLLALSFTLASGLEAPADGALAAAHARAARARREAAGVRLSLVNMSVGRRAARAGCVARRSA